MKNAQLEEEVMDYIINHNILPPPKVLQVRSLIDDSENLIYDILFDLHLLTVDQLNNILSKVTGCPAMDILLENNKVTVSETALRLLSNEEVLKHIVFPFHIDNGYVHMLMANPSDSELVKKLEEKMGYPVIRYVSYFKTILRAITRFYSFMGRRDFNEVVLNSVDEVLGKKKVVQEPSIWTSPISVELLKKDVTLFPKKIAPPPPGQVGVSILVEHIVDYAIYMGASDIHLEPFNDAIKVRLRKDGVLATEWFLPKLIQTNFFNRIKVLSGMKPTLNNRPQVGHFTYAHMVDAGVDIRVSSLPMMYGERLALRILDKNKRVANPAELGLGEDNLRIFMERIHLSQGLILVVGPTGSGKTTSIYAALEQLNKDFCSIITIEDPVEYQMSAINQIELNQLQGYTFADAFQDVLRQDPDVVLLGEIREPEAAKVAVSAASTGHLVFSTLHATCSAFAVPRLLPLGVDASVLSDVLQLVIGQRLVRVLCPHCKVPDDLTPQRLFSLSLSKECVEGHEYFVSTGCDQCGNTGYMGRMGVFEMMIPDDTMRDMILAGKPGLELYRYAVENGMQSMRADALGKARRGLTSLDEVVYHTGCGSLSMNPPALTSTVPLTTGEVEEGSGEAEIAEPVAQAT